MARNLLRIAFGAFATGLACMPVHAADLSPAEIRAELIGRSIVWWEEGGWFTGHLVLSPDGSAHVSVDDPQPTGDTGRWVLRGAQLCTAWTKVRTGAEKCYRIRRGEAGRFVTSGGNVFEIREAGV